MVEYGPGASTPSHRHEAHVFVHVLEGSLAMQLGHMARYPVAVVKEISRMTHTDYPVNTLSMAWIPLREGVSFRPVRFGLDGWTLQLRVEPGTTIARHRHTGEVHALNISGSRELIDSRDRWAWHLRIRTTRQHGQLAMLR